MYYLLALLSLALPTVHRLGCKFDVCLRARTRSLIMVYTFYAALAGLLYRTAVTLWKEIDAAWEPDDCRVANSKPYARDR